VKQSNRRHGEKRRSHNLGCSLIQLVRWLIMIYSFPAEDAERSNVSLILLHCLLTPSTPRQGEANNCSLCSVYSKQQTPPLSRGEAFDERRRAPVLHRVIRITAIYFPDRPNPSRLQSRGRLQRARSRALSNRQS